jgi:hypothetical protein
MKRREFIALLCGAATWPLAARAQQPERMRRIGVLLNLSKDDLEAQRLLTAFREGLAQLGWADGRNLRIDYRWASGDIGRIRTFARELVGLSPDVIVAYGTPVVVALQQETRSIPILFLSVTDPVGQGLVANLAHPGGNTTGFSVFEISLPSGRRLSNSWRPVLNGSSPSTIPTRHRIIRCTYGRSSKPPRRLRWSRLGSKFMTMPRSSVRSARWRMKRTAD